MINNPPSFRLPFAFPDEVHQSVKNALRLTYQKCLDLDQAIVELTPRVGAAAPAAVQAVTNITQVSGGGGGGGTFPSFGTVNLQPNLTPGSYKLAQGDLAGLILVQSGLAFALTLDSGLMTPFFTTVFNLGSADITATPSLGNVNNAASVVVKPNQIGIFFFDGTNWWDVFSFLASTFAPVASQWLRSYDAATGLFTASQPAASDLSNGTIGTGAVVLATAPTLASPVSVTGLQIFANNAAAITGGLVVGNLYRTGADPDLVACVH